MRSEVDRQETDEVPILCSNPRDLEGVDGEANPRISSSQPADLDGQPADLEASTRGLSANPRIWRG